MKSSLLREALRISLETLPKNRQKFKHWSFVVQGGKIVESGTNCNEVPPIHYGYHDRIEGNNPKIHSEIRAWRKARGLLDKSQSFEIINVRLNSRGEWRNSRPCAVCQDIMGAVGCCKVWFTTDKGWKSLALRGL